MDPGFLMGMARYGHMPSLLNALHKEITNRTKGIFFNVINNKKQLWGQRSTELDVTYKHEKVPKMDFFESAIVSKQDLFVFGKKAKQRPDFH